MIFRVCLLVIIFISTTDIIKGSLCAQNTTQTQRQEEDAIDPNGIEINGLVIDKTRTKMGRDFYQLFYTTWEAPPTKTDYIITISEQPARGRGTQVFVHVNETLSFRAFLRPSQQFIIGASKAASARTENFLRRLDKTQQNFGNEDLNGSGIF